MHSVPDVMLSKTKSPEAVLRVTALPPTKLNRQPSVADPIVQLWIEPGLNEHPVPGAGTVSVTLWAVFGPGSGPFNAVPPEVVSAESAGQMNNPFVVMQPFPSISTGTCTPLPEKVKVNVEVFAAAASDCVSAKSATPTTIALKLNFDRAPIEANTIFVRRVDRLILQFSSSKRPRLSTTICVCRSIRYS